jgi:enoyl-CoA hydratase
MNTEDFIYWKREGDIGIFSLSNGKGNYLEEPDFIDLDIFREWAEEPGLKGIIIRGIGRNFSAGANMVHLRELAQQEQVLSEKITKGKAFLDYIEQLEIPVIASINGVCFGGGLEIALACHMRIASSGALFAFPEINHGLIPGLGGVLRTVKLINNKAFEIILNGDMINVDKALNIGLIDDYTKEKDAFGYAREKLIALTQGRSAELIHYVMRALKNAELLSKHEALQKETEMFCQLASQLEI